jgi:methyl-accepting chemotaxis protein
MSQVEGSASESANFSTRVIEIADHGRERVQQTIDGIEVIRANTSEANTVIRKLGERGQEIGAIIDVISDVADETNLLALNASIIAAQAGSHGKAFAVVANQIKELADRVLKSTQEITGLIQGIQEGTIKAVETIDRGAESVRVGVEVAAEAGVSLQEITEAARLSGERTSQIVEAMRAQATSAKVVRDLMAHVTLQVEGIRHTGEKQVTGSESNLQAALVVGGIAKELQQAAEDQTVGTSKIRDNMGQVRESVDEINQALQEQSSASQEILSSTEAIQGLTTSNEVSVDAMRNVMERLNQQAVDLRAELMRFKF